MIFTNESIANQKKGIFSTGANHMGRVGISANGKHIGSLTATTPMQGEETNTIVAFDKVGFDIGIEGRDIEQIGIKLLNYYNRKRRS